MNILYHHRTQASGAVGHHIREVVKAFKRYGHLVDILSPQGVSSSQEARADVARKNRYAIPQIMFELWELLYNALDMVKIQSQLKRKKYSFIYERYAIFNLAGVISARMLRIPVILEVSFTSGTPVFPRRTRVFSYLAYLCDKFIFKRADIIVVVSSVLKNSLTKDFRVKPEKIIVLPNAVDPQEFNAKISGEPIRHKYNLGSSKVVGFVGGFFPWHGLDIFMDAAEKVLKELPATKFMLIGDGPLFNDIKNKVRQSALQDAVIFTGAVAHQELPRYIAAFDVGVMPNSNDYGSPMKIFEYMAMGKPVIAPKLKPLEEVIKDGVNGALFRPKDKQDLAESIKRVLTDGAFARKIAAQAQRKVLSKHTWDSNAQAILEKYRKKLSRKKEIRFILQYFYPEVASTAQLMVELAEGLVKEGVTVKVFCGQPTYIKSNKLPRRGVFNGIKIERLPCTRFEKNSFVGRLLNWSSFTFLVFLRLLFDKDKSPLFIVSTPPFLFAVGYLLKIIRGQRYICLIYDLYPDIAEKLGYIEKDSIISRVWHSLNKAFFRNADLVIVPSENMKTIVEQQTNSNGVKVIHNWADGTFIRPREKADNWFAQKYGLVDKLTVLYAGNIGLFHPLETLIEAADKLKDNEKIKFVFIGEGGKKKKLQDMVEEKDLKNILFLPYQHRAVLPYSLTCSDISVVSLEKNLNCVAAPCKLYTSLAAGQVILGLVDSNSDVAGIINKYQCGFSVEQDKVSSVVELLNNLSNNAELKNRLKVNARKCFEGQFQKEAAINNYLQAVATLFEEKNKREDYKCLF